MLSTRFAVAAALICASAVHAEKMKDPWGDPGNTPADLAPWQTFVRYEKSDGWEGAGYSDTRQQAINDARSACNRTVSYWSGEWLAARIKNNDTGVAETFDCGDF